MIARFVILSIFIITLAGCSTTADVERAKQAEGTWSAKFSFPTTEGTRIEQTITYSLTDVADNRGSLVEDRRWLFDELRDDAKITYYATSIVNGWWDIYGGDLYLHYELSTLKVTIDSFSVAARDDVAPELAIGVSKYRDAYLQSVVNEMHDYLRNAMIEDYKRYDIQGATYFNIGFQNDSLYYTSTDLGRVGFKKKTL